MEEAKGLVPPQESDSRWTNFRRMLRRLESDEIPHTGISVRAGVLLSRTDEIPFVEPAVGLHFTF